MWLRYSDGTAGEVDLSRLAGKGVFAAWNEPGCFERVRIAPHRAIAVQRGIEAEGVYVSYFSFGSPASRSGLFAGRRIVGVDGQPTPDLDEFLEVVSGREDRESVRINTVTWNNVSEVITLKLDNHYWPSYELLREGDSWQRRDLD